MSHFGILTSFDHTSNSWSIFKSRINQWFIANDITSTTDEEGVKRRGILLSALSDQSYKLAANLALPKDIQDVPFEDIIKILDVHFTPKRLGFTERYKFYSALQNEQENDSEFLARLRGLSKYCDFKDAEEALRDRFVLGLRPGPARDKLFEQELNELTLTKALEIAESTRCVQEVNEALKWNRQPFFGGNKVQPYQPPFYSGTRHGALFGAQATAFGGAQPSGSSPFGGAQQSIQSASFGGPPAGQPGLFGVQAQSSPAASSNPGTQSGQVASFGAPKPPPPVGISLFGVPKTQPETKIQLVQPKSP